MRSPSSKAAFDLLEEQQRERARGRQLFADDPAQLVADPRNPTPRLFNVASIEQS